MNESFDSIEEHLSLLRGEDPGFPVPTLPSSLSPCRDGLVTVGQAYVAAGRTIDAKFVPMLDEELLPIVSSCREAVRLLKLSSTAPVPSIPAAPLITAQPTGGTPSLGETPLPLRLSGPASPQGEITERAITLSGGDYLVEWAVEEPFDPAAGYCGVSVFMFDSSGENAGGVEGVSTIVTQPSHGQLAYAALRRGSYTLTAYVGCPWSVILHQP